MSRSLVERTHGRAPALPVIIRAVLQGRQVDGSWIVFVASHGFANPGYVAFEHKKLRLCSLKIGDLYPSLTFVELLRSSEERFIISG